MRKWVEQKPDAGLAGDSLIISARLIVEKRQRDYIVRMRFSGLAGAL